MTDNSILQRLIQLQHNVILILETLIRVSESHLDVTTRIRVLEEKIKVLEENSILLIDSRQ